MRIRQATAQDAGAIRAIHESAFGSNVEAELVEALTCTACFMPQLSLVAEEDGELYGHALFTRAFIVADDGHRVPVLALAPLAVRPEMQGFGVGRALVDAGIATAEELHEQVVLVLGSPKYYHRFGFEAALPYGIEPPYPVEMAAAWMALALDDVRLASVSGRVEFAAPLQAPELWTTDG